MDKFIYLNMLIGSLFCFSNPLDGAASRPFSYDLRVTTIQGTNARAMILLHGMGSDYRIIYAIKEISGTPDTMISFNFPDHGTIPSPYNIKQLSFGTINELLPALYVMKNTVIDMGFKEITLYGFSAGGGVIVNLLEALNTNIYDPELKRIGIGQNEKKQINDALQKGTIILDAPLKSIKEIIDYRGADRELLAVAKHYRVNNMEPIETLNRLHNLNYQILVYFEKPDEILSNRDDDLFFQRLQKANSKGFSVLLVDHTEGHNGAHMLLWNYYNKETGDRRREPGARSQEKE